ncbi:MAG TPA: winged helix-turn-helix domain-containing protein [Terriglobales bacterium]|nr:winged helix-turn-helix domain-containing protein [Terriglobales bacterium]
MRKYELRRSGQPVKLERIPMELLILLVESRGTLVTRETIIERLWGKDVFLETERGINTAINKLRVVLRDDPRQPQFLQTVIGKGYRFIAEVQIDSDEEPSLLPTPLPAISAVASPDPKSFSRLVDSEAPVLEGHLDPAVAEHSVSDRFPPSTEVTPFLTAGQQAVSEDGSKKSPRRKFQLLLLTAAVASLGLLLGYFLAGGTARKAPRKFRSVAVLPLLNLSQNSEQEYFVDGMTDQLITDLARATPLRVISRTSTMQYKGTHKSLPEIAKDLNVDAIVEGSVLPSQGNVRITAQLLDARTDRHLWAQSYERSSQDLLAMQDEVARDVVHEIAATLQPASQGTHQQNVNPEAYDEYLHGRFLWNRRTLADLEKSIDYYQQAIRLAPAFAPAYAALGDAYAVISLRGGPPPSDSYPRAREAAEKALQLDDSLADAHALLGEVRVNYDHDWDGGEKEFRRAVELNPNYPTAHQWYASFLASMKRMQEAEAEIDKASLLDPLSLIINATRGEIRYFARDPNSAIKLCLHAQELDPNFAETYLFLGKAYEQERQFHEADASFKRAVDLSSGRPGPLILQAHAYGLSGRKDLALASIDRLLSSQRGYVANSDVAAVYCAVGEPSLAMTWLEKALANHEEGLNQLAVEPMFDGCRQDTRFQALIQRLGLPQ